MGLVGLKIGLVQAACDEQKEVITDLVRNEVYGNEVVQVEVGKELGPVIREFEVLSLIKPKEKEETSEERKVQQQDPDRMVKQAARGRIKIIVREKGKAQVVEKFGQAQEVSKKRKGNAEMFLKPDGRDQKRLCEGENEGVNIYLLKQR